MGSHAEKEYILKLNHKAFDGIVIGANVIEAMAGATASLIAQKLRLPYYIDPMTYVFGCDLDGIRSEQKQIINGKKQTVIAYKKSYELLASNTGFANVLKSGIPISPTDFPLTSIQSICEQTVNYQLSRIREEFEKDNEYKEYASSIALPSGVFAPYFYIPSKYKEGLDLFLTLSATTAKIKSKIPIYAVLCADHNLLNSKSFVDEVVKTVPKTGLNGIWLWFSKFDELEAQEDTLKNFTEIVKRLSQSGLKVYNRHGGYFSLILHKLGMEGVSHGVGYGEKKDVHQESAPNAPIVNYYLPDVYKRFGVDAIERCFDELNITNPQEFYSSICDCVICKGVIQTDISEFRSFGETHRAKPTSKRPSQTPAAAKRCRYHFLMNRIREKNFIGKNDLSSIVKKMEQSKDKWGKCGSIQIGYIEKWINSLK